MRSAKVAVLIVFLLSSGLAPATVYAEAARQDGSARLEVESVNGETVVWLYNRQERFELSNGATRFAFAVAQVVTDGDGTVRSIPLLAQLGSGAEEIIEVRPLVRNPNFSEFSTRQGAHARAE